jgi:hypothetical protein
MSTLPTELGMMTSLGELFVFSIALDLYSGAYNFDHR